jgi:hypothetical protein
MAFKPRQYVFLAVSDQASTADKRDSIPITVEPIFLPRTTTSACKGFQIDISEKFLHAASLVVEEVKPFQNFRP